MRTLAAVAVVVAALQAVMGAAAYSEAEARGLDGAIEAVWHAPEVVAPHTQWHGFLRPVDATQFANATYQICQVGKECFAPPHAATRLANGTFAFDTSDYQSNGGPIDYLAGWRIGVKWVLTANDGSTLAIPVGPDDASASCRADPIACAESHYIAFDMPTANRNTPTNPMPIALIALLALAFVRRNPGA